MSATFLDENELAEFTGRKFKSKQIEALRKMGIAFFVNAVGKPVVTRSAIEGKKEQIQHQPKWEMPRHGKKAK
ncbi:DUF4224 domain-containing protein [Noviherbaspirillum malthae]|uniref:DUF4224 domain-containing protein n=1 Tax=Noviherbaspirillum malthae TaxID=1260987 RepID=UPI00188E56C7|nr:DUF4224 domain-containing protein [Noviherbaspirillum malthae]